MSSKFPKTGKKYDDVIAVFLRVDSMAENRFFSPS